MARTGLGICTVTSGGEIVGSSDGIAGMLGYPDAPATLGLNLTSGVYVDEGEHARILAGADSPSAEWTETRWRRRDGSLIIVRLAVRRTQREPGAHHFE